MYQAIMYYVNMKRIRIKHSFVWCAQSFEFRCAGERTDTMHFGISGPAGMHAGRQVDSPAGMHSRQTGKLAGRHT